MTEYLLNITGIVLISTILTNILPLGKTSQIIKNVVRLCLYLAILSPVYQFFQNQFSKENDNIFKNYFSENVIETDRSFIEYCSEKSVENAERLIEEELLNEYGIIANVTVQVLDDSFETERKIEKICIESENVDKKTIENLEATYETKFLVDIEWIQRE